MRTFGGPGNAVAAAALVAAVDLATKLAAERELVDAVALIGGARLRVSHNTGVAFGGLAGAPSWLVIGVVLVSLLGLLLTFARGLLAGGPLVIGLVIGGAVANLVDRLEGGGVTDFIDLGAWPSFNLADVALSVGIVLLLVGNLRAPAPPSATPGRSANATQRNVPLD